MHGIAIRVGINRNCRNAEPLCGFYDPAGNLAAIGYQDFGEHHGGPESARVLVF
jgi:hypothetical protein